MQRNIVHIRENDFKSQLMFVDCFANLEQKKNVNSTSIALICLGSLVIWINMKILGLLLMKLHFLVCKLLQHS